MNPEARLAMLVTMAMLLLTLTFVIGRRPVGAESPVVPTGTRIHVNQAGPAELCLLPGVGVKLAERIVRDRESSGPFPSADEMARVKGLGGKTLARIRPFVEVGRGGN